MSKYFACVIRQLVKVHNAAFFLLFRLHLQGCCTAESSAVSPANESSVCHRQPCFWFTFGAGNVWSLTCSADLQPACPHVDVQVRDDENKLNVAGLVVTDGWSLILILCLFVCFWCEIFGIDLSSAIRQKSDTNQIQTFSSCSVNAASVWTSSQHLIQFFSFSSKNDEELWGLIIKDLWDIFYSYITCAKYSYFYLNVLWLAFLICGFKTFTVFNYQKTRLVLISGTFQRSLRVGGWRGKQEVETANEERGQNQLPLSVLHKQKPKATHELQNKVVGGSDLQFKLSCCSSTNRETSGTTAAVGFVSATFCLQQEWKQESMTALCHLVDIYQKYMFSVVTQQEVNRADSADTDCE